MPWGAGPDDGWTYLIQSVHGGPVKIGFTRNDPNERLVSLQAGNPEELQIILLLRGVEHEAALHRQYAEHRIRGEWFSSIVAELVDLDLLEIEEFV